MKINIKVLRCRCELAKLKNNSSRGSVSDLFSLKSLLVQAQLWDGNASPAREAALGFDVAFIQGEEGSGCLAPLCVASGRLSLVLVGQLQPFCTRSA